MSSSSNISCCVPLCNQRGGVDANGKRVGFFNFPKDPNLRAQWLQKIRRDVRTKFKLTEITNVCSLHFRESEIKNGLGGRKMRVDIHHHSSFEICIMQISKLHGKRDRRRLQDFHRRRASVEWKNHSRKNHPR